jgi:hypothetical protein
MLHSLGLDALSSNLDALLGVLAKEGDWFSALA